MVPKRAKASLLVLVVAAATLLGVAVGASMPRNDDYLELRKHFRIFGAVYEELVSGYVKPVNPEHLMRVGIEAMLSELDPYTTFIDEADNSDINIITEGRYGGVGLEIGKRGGKMTVGAPIEGASGYKQGVRAGDVITRINDQSVSSLSTDDVETLLRGEPGTTVQVTVEREGAPAPLTFTLTREQVDLDNVAYRGLVGDADDVGYIKMERFTRGAALEVEEALNALRDESELRGVILDLRDNPGGLLNAAVRVADLFLAKNAVVVSTEGRLEKANTTYRADRAPVVTDLPLVVLVNQYSASASEIVAGAVQDHDRGAVMGATTYGKGLVQAIRSLPHNTSLKMTTAQYRTPSGRSIQDVGPGSLSDSSTAHLGGSVDSSTAAMEHKTTHGRTVRDGNGLRPDVRIEEAESSPLEEALQRRAAFFYYANHYAATRDTLPPNFSATDAVLDDFRSWLEAEDLRYPTDAELALNELRDRFPKNDTAAVKDEMAALREAIRTEKRAGFTEHADALKRQLEREILARFVSGSEQTAAMLPRDRQVENAVALLHEDQRYADILAPDDE